MDLFNFLKIIKKRIHLTFRQCFINLIYEVFMIVRVKLIESMTLFGKLKTHKPSIAFLAYSLEITFLFLEAIDKAKKNSIIFIVLIHDNPVVIPSVRARDLLVYTLQLVNFTQE